MQARIAFVQETYGYAGLVRGADATYLLTGFLKCGNCGANLTIVCGRGKRAHPSYGCPQNYYRGACTNNLKARQDRLEQTLLAGLQQAVLQSDAIEYAIKACQEQLNERVHTLQEELGHANQRKAELEKELGNLINAVAACAPHQR